MFEKRDDIDAAALKDGAAFKVDRRFVAGDGPQLLHDGSLLARQEARPHAIGAVPEPQVEARRLQLAVLDEFLRQDHAPAQHDFDLLTREQPEMRAEIILVQIWEEQFHGQAAPFAKQGRAKPESAAGAPRGEPSCLRYKK